MLYMQVFAQAIFKVLYTNEAGNNCLAAQLLFSPHEGRVDGKDPAFLDKDGDSLY